jgi:hypothetical protein
MGWHGRIWSVMKLDDMEFWFMMTVPRTHYSVFLSYFLLELKYYYPQPILASLSPDLSDTRHEFLIAHLLQSENSPLSITC